MPLPVQLPVLNAAHNWLTTQLVACRWPELAAGGKVERAAFEDWYDFFLDFDDDTDDD